MTKYPVFRSLYKPLFMAGVPLMFLFGEIITIAIFVILRLYVLIPVIIAIHIIASRSYRKDPYFISIMLDVSGLNGGTAERRRKADDAFEEKQESHAENS